MKKIREYIAIDRDSRVPLFRQVEAGLAAYIREHSDGRVETLPSEPELATGLGVSRNTVRNALAALAAARMIRRKKHRGTEFGGASNGLEPGSLAAGLVFPSLPIAIDAGFIAAFTRLAGGASAECRLYEYAASGQPTFRQMLAAAAEKCAGVIVKTTENEVLEKLSATGFPVVACDHQHPRVSGVGSDRFEAGRLLTRHLLHKGCRRIAVIRRPPGDDILGEPDGNRFADGCAAELERAGLPVPPLLTEMPVLKEFTPVLRRFLADNRPDGLAVASLIGVSMVALFNTPFREQLLESGTLVAGFAHTGIPAAFHPAGIISAIAMPDAEAMAEAALELLTTRIAERSRTSRRILVSPHIEIQ